MKRMGSLLHCPVIALIMESPNHLKGAAMNTVAIWICVPTYTDPNARRWIYSHAVTWAEYESRAKTMPGEGHAWKAALA